LSFGKMSVFIKIVEKVILKDDEGFSSETDVILASVRAYKERRRGTEIWANRTTFSTATDLFRFRCIPGVAVTTDLSILTANSRFEILSVEDVKNRKMYIEVLAREVKPSG